MYTKIIITYLPGKELAINFAIHPYFILLDKSYVGCGIKLYEFLIVACLFSLFPFFHFLVIFIVSIFRDNTNMDAQWLCSQCGIYFDILLLGQ